MFTPITPIPAPTEGGLPGSSTTCTVCGLEIAYSLESMVVADARTHRAYHDRQRAIGATIRGRSR